MDTYKKTSNGWVKFYDEGVNELLNNSEYIIEHI